MILDLLARARGGRIEIAPGCFVTYELETIDILGALVRPPTTDALRRYYEDFVELHGLRPRAIEAYHDGYNPRAMRPRHGSWLGFIAAMRGLGEEQRRAFERHRAFLEALEATPMTRSYKMLVLQAMLNEDSFPRRDRDRATRQGRRASGIPEPSAARRSRTRSRPDGRPAAAPREVSHRRLGRRQRHGRHAVLCV